MSEYELSAQSQIALQAAHEAAAAYGHQLVTTGHLLLGILQTEDDPEADFGRAVLRAHRIDRQVVEHLLRQRLGKRDPLAAPRPLAMETQDTLERAEAARQIREDELIRTEHLVAGMAESRTNVAALILNMSFVQKEVFQRRRRNVA